MFRAPRISRPTDKTIAETNPNERIFRLIGNYKNWNLRKFTGFLGERVWFSVGAIIDRPYISESDVDAALHQSRRGSELGSVWAERRFQQVAGIHNRLDFARERAPCRQILRDRDAQRRIVVFD